MNDLDDQCEEPTVTVTTDREAEDDKDKKDKKDDKGEKDGEGAPELEGGAQDAENRSVERESTGRSWRRRAVVGVIAAAMIGGFATSGFLGWQLWQDQQVAHAGEQARTVAVQYAKILTSIDSEKVDENFDQVLDGATGEFKDMYSQSSTELRQLLVDNKASAHGVVVESAIQSASKDKVVVLLFVDQSVSNATAPDPRIDRSRIKMTMEYVDDRWRASKVELP